MDYRRMTIAIVGLVLLSVIVFLFYLVGEVSVENAEAEFSNNSIVVLLDIRNTMFRKICIVDVELSGRDSYLQGSVRVEFHRARIVDNVARMEKVDFICIGQKSLFSMRDRGLHIMIIGGEEDIKKIINDGIYANIGIIKYGFLVSSDEKIVGGFAYPLAMQFGGFLFVILLYNHQEC